MMEKLDLKQVQWYHIADPTEEDFNFLEQNFDFHPLDIEDCRSYTQRPKIDEYDDYYFLILHFPFLEPNNQFLRTREVKIFWSKKYIITLGKGHWVIKDIFNIAKHAPDEEEELLQGSTDMILYSVLNRLMQESYLLINRMGSDIEIVNRDLFDHRAEFVIEKISVIRKNIIQLNTIFKPQKQILSLIESGKYGFADSEEMEDYWGNIVDIYQKMWDMIEDYGELIDGLAKTYDSLLANKTNEIMKVLTLISTILLPLTFISGLYGMNVALPFGDHPYAFWGIVAFSIFVVGSMLFVFRKKKWF